MFATFKAPSGEFTSLREQVDQTPVEKAEDVDGLLEAP